MIAAAAYAAAQDLAKCIMTNPTAVPWSTIANATHSLLDKRLMASDLGENERLLGNERPQRIERRVSRPTIDGADATFSSIVTGVLTFTVFVTLIGFLTGAWFVQQQSHRPYIVHLLLLSIIPSVFILYFAYYWRNKDSVPVPLVIGCYLVGIFMALPVALVESLVTESLFPERPKGSIQPALTTH